MKKIFFMTLALIWAGMTMADNRVYLMADERAITDPNWVSMLPDEVKNTMFLWIREWGDQSMTCALNMSADPGPSGFPYYIFTPAPNSEGVIGGYYGIGYINTNGDPVDMTMIDENWYLNVIMKSNCPFIQICFKDGKHNDEWNASISLHELFGPGELDNQTWKHFQIPFYELQDLGLDWSEPMTTKLQWFSLLTNNNTPAMEELCIDAVYFASEEGTGIEQVRLNDKAAMKVMMDGQLIIKRGHQLFNALGQEL